MRLGQSAASKSDVPDADIKAVRGRGQRKVILITLIGLASVVEMSIVIGGVWQNSVRTRRDAERAEARRIGMIADRKRTDTDGVPLLEGPVTAGGPTWGKSQWADIEWLENGWFLFGRDGAWETDPNTRRYVLVRFRNKSGRNLYNVQVPIELYTDAGLLRTDVCTIGNAEDGQMRRKTCGPVPLSVTMFRALGFRGSWTPVKSKTPGSPY